MLLHALAYIGLLPEMVASHIRTYIPPISPSRTVDGSEIRLTTWHV